jgi:prolyl-tRNA synthetase
MRQSQLFTKTRKDAPKDEVSKNADLLIRAGFIHKEMAGVYSYLPLGLRVINKIVEIIREEMNAIGGVELSLTALQDKNVWEKSGRWSDEVLDVWFKTKLKNNTEVGLGTTHEEELTNLMKDYIRSYRDLPVYAYQFQTKFRNEARAKSGIMRTREFLMKDLYSFSKDENAHNAFYEKAKQAYINIFNRVGLGDRTFVTFASGGSFSKYSHEFQTITDAGEDSIFVEENKKIAVNKEVLNDEVLKDLGIDKRNLVEKKAVEVGNIFSLGTKFSDAFDLTYSDEKGDKQKVIMGSYGIGPGRVMGTLAEVLSDEKGLVWPTSVAPFAVHLISIEDKEGKVKKEADTLYEKMIKEGIEVLYDDRDMRAGEKFADSDLMGIPERIVISEKTLESRSVEVKNRKSGEVGMKGIDIIVK